MTAKLFIGSLATRKPTEYGSRFSHLPVCIWAEDEEAAMLDFELTLYQRLPEAEGWRDHSISITDASNVSGEISLDELNQIREHWGIPEREL